MQEQEEKKWYPDLTQRERYAIDQYIDENPVLTPYVLEIIGQPLHLDLEKHLIYVLNGDVYYAQTYEWIKAGYFRDYDDYEDDEFVARDWEKVGTLQEMLDSYEE